MQRLLSSLLPLVVEHYVRFCGVMNAGSLVTEQSGQTTPTPVLAPFSSWVPSSLVPSPSWGVPSIRSRAASNSPHSAHLESDA
jgi:hypothetical protein